MVVPTEFLDPFDDDLVAFPVRRRSQFRMTVVELVIGAIIFLAVVAVYNALFSMWERLFLRRRGPPPEFREVEENDEVYIRITYALLAVAISYVLVVWLRRQFEVV